MRIVSAYLFMSMDGVVESPDKFIRPESYPHFPDVIEDQDIVLLGRRTYEEWVPYWPTSTLEPFATFINQTPKLVVSRTLKNVGWAQCALLEGELRPAVEALKAQPGRKIGVHGSITLVQSLLAAGLLDELRLLRCPAIAGRGRRLLEGRDGEPLQWDLRSTRTLPTGLEDVVYTRKP